MFMLTCLFSYFRHFQHTGPPRSTQYHTTKMTYKCTFLFIAVVALTLIDVTCAKSEDESVENEDPVEVDEEKIDYAKGSVCGYCVYCEFCSLCDRDCPCESSPSKPNCHMCKYCKFCYLCSAVCDTICQPGGILDKVSGAIVNSLPSYDKEEIDEDINSVKGWIDENKKEEL